MGIGDLRVNQDGGRWGTFSLSSERQNQKHAQSGVKQVTLNGMQTLLTGICLDQSGVTN